MESPRLDKIIHHIDTPTSPSPEMFSFPGTPTDEQSEFEFGSCVTPDSPTMSSSDVTKNNLVDDFSTTSPADQFFLNGRLLPHDFPVVHPTSSSTRASFSGRENMGPGPGPGPGATLTLSRGTSAGSNRSGSSSGSSSGGSQYSSKEYSLVSSRSNSTNSSSGSTCTSSARISSSEITSERKTFPKRMNSVREKSNLSNSPLGKYYKFGASGSSQRWQFITAAPVLGPSQSRRGRRDNASGGTGTSPRMMRDVGSKDKRGGDNNNGSFLYKILRSVVATCKACHAMEVQENEFELDATNNVLGH